MSKLLFQPLTEPYQVLPHWATVDLETMAMKEYYQSSRITGALQSDCLESFQDTRWGGLPLFRDVAGVFCSPSRLHHIQREKARKVGLIKLLCLMAR